jgi:hypothetical protein
MATACESFIFYRGQKFWGAFLKVLVSDLSATRRAGRPYAITGRRDPCSNAVRGAVRAL